jgi:hypothetical protein
MNHETSITSRTGKIVGENPEQVGQVIDAEKLILSQEVDRASVLEIVFASPPADRRNLS